MATYYVRTDGNDSNAGTGPASNQAWGTIAKALSSSAGIVGGDTIYIAPGNYREQVTATLTSPSSTVNIIGDPTASVFTGISAGPVRLTGFINSGTGSSLSAPLLSTTSKANLSFRNILFEGFASGGSGGNLVSLVTSNNITFLKCLFVNEGATTSGLSAALLVASAPAGAAMNLTLSKCIFVMSGAFSVGLFGNNVADATSISDCLFQGGTFYCVYFSNIQTSVFNNTFLSNTAALTFNSGSASFPSVVRNCLFLFNGTGISGASTIVTENYNRFVSCTAARAGTVAVGENSVTGGASRLDYGYSRLVGLNPIDFYGPVQGSPNQGFGTATGAEATDVMSIAWTGTSPDSGYQTYSTAATTLPTYQPTERNASTITIAPGSTSQSIELYLGATGLTASTSGLSARYNRTRTASVSIPLVARTIAQAWTSGGFAEVDPVGMPGVYRLDVPDAAFDYGVEDVTVIVRGASGTNGAVVTCNMQGIAGNIVHIGPFKVIGDGLGSDQPLDIVQGVQAPVSVQLVDANENGVDISGATVEAKVYNAIGSLIATYSCVPVYAADGRCTFQLTTSVTNTAGVYNVTLTRTIGGNIVVFGPMKMIVRAN